MLNRRFLITLATFLVIVAIASLAIFLAKGYRLSTQTGTIAGTGIISVTSIPDQASVYLDGHLTTATNANINSLPPKVYEVRIVKEGYIPWQKKVEVKEGLVFEIKATLFRSIPTIYPLTYSGAQKLTLSPDRLKLAYIVPDSEETNLLSTKKGGIWVWPMGSESTLNFGRGNDPRQIAASNGIDFTNALLRWSPDSTQVLVQLPDRNLLLDIDRFTDPPRDITAQLDPTLKSWEETESKSTLGRLQLIKDINLRKTASDSASLSWSKDETKILFRKDDKSEFTVADLTTNKSYPLPEAAQFVWLPDSEHLIMAEYDRETKSPAPSLKPSPSPSGIQNTPLQSQFVPTKISIIETDGQNKSEIYFGNLDPVSIFAWPDASRLVVVSSLPTATGSKPNLYGINLK